MHALCEMSGDSRGSSCQSIVSFAACMWERSGKEGQKLIRRRWFDDISENGARSVDVGSKGYLSSDSMSESG